MLFYESLHNCIGHIWRASLTRVLPCVSSKCPSRLLTKYNCCICETFSLTFVKYHSLVLILYVCFQIKFLTCFKVTIFTCKSQVTCLNRILNSFLELEASISIIALNLVVLNVSILRHVQPRLNPLPLVRTTF